MNHAGEKTSMSFVQLSRRSKIWVIAGSAAALVIVGGAATAVEVTAGGHDSPVSGPSSPIAYAPTQKITTPGTSLLTNVLPALPWVGKVLSQVSLGSGPSDVPSNPVASSSAGQWLTATIQSGGDEFKELWMAELAQGALAESLATSETKDLSQVISGATVNIVGADGTTTPETLGAGSVAPGQVFTSTGETDDQITSDVDATLKQFSLTPTSVSVLHPLDPAVAIVATAPSAEAIGSRFQDLQAALSGSPANYEGVYIEIDLPDGSRVVQSSAAFRTGASSISVKPSDAIYFGLPSTGGDAPDPSQVP